MTTTCDVAPSQGGVHATLTLQSSELEPPHEVIFYHRRRMSVSSQGPPISLYNHSFSTHHRNDSSAGSTGSSVAIFYARHGPPHGANSGMAAWTRHHKEVSVDSIMSNFSGMHGLGDKMFDNAADLRPLTSISASPL